MSERPEQHRHCFDVVLDPPSCRRCRKGHIVKRHGKFGEFYGCCEYPRCTFTCDVSDANSMYDADPDEPYFGM